MEKGRRNVWTGKAILSLARIINRGHIRKTQLAFHGYKLIFLPDGMHQTSVSAVVQAVC